MLLNTLMEIMFFLGEAVKNNIFHVAPYLNLIYELEKA